ncbi:unnamed protein product [Dibothriocephalus latus]|uniref:Uncharacterized protein n=1 Tax=Dibothriocephalus latus TaxID=60516 RepID=A0A3P7LK94_DIBLA|nr:unnamed protein product [Dibothriocephalus latus]
MVDAWVYVSVSFFVIRAFTKAGIVSDLLSKSNDTDSDNGQSDPHMVDAIMTQLFNWQTEDEEFEGFTAEE